MFALEVLEGGPVDVIGSTKHGNGGHHGFHTFGEDQGVGGEDVG